MPLMRFDLVEGRTPHELKVLLDAAHRAMVDSFDVPERDRYQIVHEHPERHLIVEDTGLDIPRTRARVVVSLTSRPPSTPEKQKSYPQPSTHLKPSCGIVPPEV